MNTAIVMNYSNKTLECINVKKKKGDWQWLKEPQKQKKIGNARKTLNLRPPYYWSGAVSESQNVTAFDNVPCDIIEPFITANQNVPLTCVCSCIKVQ